MFIITLIHYRLAAFMVEEVERSIRLFSSLENAEMWLKGNNFIFGQRFFVNYPENEKEWYNKDDMPWDHVDVKIAEMSVDDFSDSKYKHFRSIQIDRPEGWTPW